MLGRAGRLIVLAWLATFATGGLALAEERNEVPEPLIYYAGMVGRLTTDRDGEGGNPFASALVEVLADETLRLRDFGTKLAALTMGKSGGWQSPEIPRRVAEPDWAFGDGAGEDRVALVLVNADYSQSGVASLPGAAFDAVRVPAALERAGFAVTLVLDAGGDQVSAALEAFSVRSALADVALVYLGGHGVQPGRDVYWLYGDYPDPESRGALDTHALKVSAAGDAARGRLLNFVFYAACRDDPFVR